MIVKTGSKYCGEHQSSSDPDRIPCPYDSKHTCSASKLERHLEICNSRPANNRPDYLVTGINKGDDTETDQEVGEKLTVNSVSDEHLLRLIEKIKNTFDNFLANSIEDKHLEHSVLGEELSNKDYGPSVLKHHIQNSSLVGHLAEAGLLQSHLTFVEFGSGRGSLSYWLCRALGQPHTAGLVMIDRASPRHKLDSKMKELELKEMLRIKADIEDLDLSKVFDKPENVVAVSKHLCGAATDLTLRCLTALPSEQLKGVMIALCCHHRCAWPPYVGKQFMAQQGFSAEDFSVLTSISSWATCGFGKNKQSESEDITDDHELDHEDQSQQFHPNDRFEHEYINIYFHLLYF